MPFLSTDLPHQGGKRAVFFSCFLGIHLTLLNGVQSALLNKWNHTSQYCLILSYKLPLETVSVLFSADGNFPIFVFFYKILHHNAKCLGTVGFFFPIRLFFQLVKELAKKKLNFGGGKRNKNLLFQLALLFTSLIIFFFLQTTNLAQLKGNGLILIFYMYNCSYSWTMPE